jgi:hypothetical protein
MISSNKREEVWPIIQPSTPLTKLLINSSPLISIDNRRNLKNTVFWDITPCSPLEANRRVEGHIASVRLSTCFHVCILLGLFDPEDVGDKFL